VGYSRRFYQAIRLRSNRHRRPELVTIFQVRILRMIDELFNDQGRWRIRGRLALAVSTNDRSGPSAIGLGRDTARWEQSSPKPIE